MLKNGKEVLIHRDYYDPKNGFTLHAGNSYVLNCQYGSYLCFLNEDGSEEIDLPIREAYNYIEFHRRRLFVDMDGTLAKFQEVEYPEQLYEKGYFENLSPIEPLISAMNNILCEYPEVEIYILSSVLPDSPYALNEKQKWIDTYFPAIPKERRYFPECGTDKRKSIPGGISKEDILLDDYTKNLLSWKEQGTGIKVLNGINHRRKTWQGAVLEVNDYSDSWELEEEIIKIMKETAMRREKNTKKSYCQR